MNVRRNLFNHTAMSATLAAVALGSAAPAWAQTAAIAPTGGSSPTSAESLKNPEAIVPELVVTGRRSVAGGLMKLQSAAETMSSITPAAIAEKAPSASPLQLVSTVPGVNFGSTGTFGLAARNFLSVRGLDQTELGSLIEGIPGTDIASYFPYTESWADNENISDITLTPGNSRLQDPIISASGGEFIESVRMPRDRFGGMVSASGGSYGSWRTFGSLDSGNIGQTGAKAFLSYSYTHEGNFVGPGANTRQHIDFKVTEDWSPNAHSSLFLSYNYLTNARLQILTLAQANTGLATDNLGQFQYASKFVPGVTPNYYKNFEIPRPTYILASNNDFELSDKVSLHITPYARYTYSFANGQSNLNPASIFNGNQRVTAAFNPSSLQNGLLFTQSETELNQYQYGVSSYLEADLTPQNHLMAGYWHENWRLGEVAFYNQLGLDGTPAATGKSSALRTTGGALITGTHFTARTRTDQIFIGDTQSMLDDKLKISVGFKQLFYHVDGKDLVIGAPPTFSAHASKPMPRILVSYDVNPSMQIYANVTTNTRMPLVMSTYVTNFSTTTGGFAQVGAQNIKPEYSTGAQIGYRYQGLVNLDVNAFYMKLKDHQVSSLVLINNSLLPQALSVGGETIKGASLEVSTRSYNGFSLYGSAQYLHGTFDDNVPRSGDFLPTAGKKMVESPDWITSVSARYDKGPFFAELIHKYVDSQYTSFMNDQVMPSYNTLDLAMGYRLPNYRGFINPVLRLNLNNLRNKSYIASVASVTPNAVTTKGINGATLAGTAPSYYVGAPLVAMVTLSTEF
jgi:iron complex outermembrane receptor protein